MNTPFEIFVAYLEENDFHFTIKEEGRVLTANFSGPNGRWSCVLVVHQEGKFVTFASILPCIVPPNQRAACADLLNQINYGLCFGNFEMDPKDGDVQFRLSLPIFDGILPDDAPHFLLDISRGATNQYLPAIMGLVYANQSPAQALNPKPASKKRTPKPRFQMN